jgi:hypothetical protein
MPRGFWRYTKALVTSAAVIMRLKPTIQMSRSSFATMRASMASMAGSGIGKFKAPFYSLKARVDSVEPPGLPGIVARFDGNQIADGKLKRCHPAFHVGHIVANRVNHAANVSQVLKHNVFRLGHFRVLRVQI